MGWVWERNEKFPQTLTVESMGASGPEMLIIESGQSESGDN
jgi:hypothetical protein